MYYFCEQKLVMENTKLAVVAFGGNALLRAGQKGRVEEQAEMFILLAKVC